ncbi:hypothetical protein C8J57DRAFT_498341 [Mycena rebaudengoi]|nr:hypothetical protein C8J57DRAFT_498341 [Mycena rebaudengoi]
MSRLLPRTPSRWSATSRTSPHSAPPSRPSPTHRQRTQRGGEADVSSSRSDTAAAPGLFRHHPHARSEAVDQDVCVSALDISVCKRVPFYPESRTSAKAFEAGPSPVLDVYDSDALLNWPWPSVAFSTEAWTGRTCPRTDGTTSLSSYSPCSLNAPSSLHALSSTNAILIPGLRARGVKSCEDTRVIHTRRRVCRRSWCSVPFSR